MSYSLMSSGNSDRTYVAPSAHNAESFSSKSTIHVAQNSQQGHFDDLESGQQWCDHQYDTVSHGLKKTSSSPLATNATGDSDKLTDIAENNRLWSPRLMIANLIDGVWKHANHDDRQVVDEEVVPSLSALLKPRIVKDISSRKVIPLSFDSNSMNSSPPSDTILSSAIVKELDFFQMVDSRLLYQWPFIAIAMIHFRLLLFQFTHQYFNTIHYHDDICLEIFTAISLLSFMILVLSQVYRRYILRSHSSEERSNIDKRVAKVDSATLVSVTTCFCLLLLILSAHDRTLYIAKHHVNISHYIETHRDGNLMFEGHIGCTIHNEFMFYVMMVPYLLYCRCVHASARIVYLSWSIGFISICTSLLLMTVDNHAKYSFPYAISLTLVSFAILVNKRRKRVNHCAFYRQFEELKVKHNQLSEQLEIKQKEIVTQRYILANTAHDMKTVS